MLRFRDWLAKVDLKDFVFPIHYNHRQYLCFTNSRMSLLAFPSACHQHHGSLPRPVVAVLRGTDHGRVHRQTTGSYIYLLECLGFIINYKMTPTQTIKFLGNTVDSLHINKPTPEKRRIQPDPLDRQNECSRYNTYTS